MSPVNSTEKNPHGQMYLMTKGHTSVVSTIPSITEDVRAHKMDSEERLAWILGCASVCVFVFLVATIQYFRKRNSSIQKKRERRQKRLVRVLAHEERDIEKLCKDPVPASDFLRVLKDRRKRGFIDTEFKGLERHQDDYPADVALHYSNQSKNKYPEFVAYDHNRVVLAGYEVDSNYINASYIASFKKSRSYIALQGPIANCVDDFWHMAWEQNVHCIVMATNIYEHARAQCEKYWSNKTEVYGQFEVTQLDMESTADFTIRTFLLVKLTTGEQRLMKQFQFASWSESHCPKSSSVIEFHRRVKAYTCNSSGPILVHCGNGAGRTGTYIAIDIALEQLTHHHTVDIFNIVLELRNSRPGMVTCKEQYVFIYDTIAMYLQCGTTVISINELPAVVGRLAHKEHDTKHTGFEREFKTLLHIVPKIHVGECAGGHRVENRKKSRDIMVQPPERARPYLLSFERSESSDFINAVYVDGYHYPESFIVTQWPLKHTINDFWRLILDYQIATIVVLNDHTASRNYPQFWPTLEDLRKCYVYGAVSVEFTDIENHETMITRTFLVKKALANLDTRRDYSTRKVKMVQLTCWPNGHKVPTSSSGLFDLLDVVQCNQDVYSNRRSPICVVSKNGVSRCGVFCVISYACEKLKAEGEVDIFKAALNVKQNRPPLVENIIEYMYCYTFSVIACSMMTTSLSSVHRPLVVISDPSTSQLAHHTSRNISDASSRKQYLGDDNYDNYDTYDDKYDNYAYDHNSEYTTSFQCDIFNLMMPEHASTMINGILHSTMSTSENNSDCSHFKKRELLRREEVRGNAILRFIELPAATVV